MSEIALGLIFYVSVSLLGFLAGLFFFFRARARRNELNAEWEEFWSKRRLEATRAKWDEAIQQSVHEPWPIYEDGGTINPFYYYKAGV